MEFRIGDANEALLPQIQRIEQQSFSVPWTEQMLRMQLEPDTHVFLTAETAEGVVGYVGMMYVLDEGYIPTSPCARTFAGAARRTPCWTRWRRGRARCGSAS